MVQEKIQNVHGGEKRPSETNVPDELEHGEIYGKRNRRRSEL